MQEQKHPLPPFDETTAVQKVRMAENAWNLKDPNKISMAYSADSKWRNRDVFINGRDEIVAFLTKKFEKNKHTDSVKKYGDLDTTESLCVSPMSGTMSVGNGGKAMVMKIGNLTKMD